jgi:hypothetical protein
VDPIRLLRTTRPAFVLAGLMLLLAAPTARAQQFVLFDATFTFTKEDADNSKPSKSHYYVRDKMLNADRPKDWTTPPECVPVPHLVVGPACERQSLRPRLSPRRCP